MHIEHEVKLDFKDVLIRPKRSTLTSRAEVEIEREFRFRHAAVRYFGIPIVAANMDTTGTIEMAGALEPLGLSVALHKHYKPARYLQFFGALKRKSAHYFRSESRRRTKKIPSGGRRGGRFHRVRVH